MNANSMLIARRAILPRIGLIAAALLVFSTLAAGVASAQVILCPPNPCPCDAGLIKVSRELRCGITVCGLEITGSKCTTLPPGYEGKVRCDIFQKIVLRDCRGVLICLPRPGECVTCVCEGEACCVDICMEETDNGCLVLTAKPSICRGC